MWTPERAATVDVTVANGDLETQMTGEECICVDYSKAKLNRIESNTEYRAVYDRVDKSSIIKQYLCVFPQDI